MKKLSESLYVVVPGTYVDRRPDGWHVSDEESKSLAGPFDSPEAARDHFEGAAAEEGAANAKLSPSTLGPPTVVTPLLPELVTLRQAALLLPVTHQALYARRRTGGLPAPAAVHGTAELYRFAELAALFEGRSLRDRVTEGNRRSWERLTDAERAERIAKIQKGRR